MQVKKILQYVVDWIFPLRKSEQTLKHITHEDILDLPKAAPIEAENTYALFSYRDSRVTSLIWEIKYHKNTHALSLIAPLLADLIQEEYAEKALFENWDACLLIPVPSTKTHVREHGYADTQCICEALVPFLPPEIVYSPQVLTKIVDTPKQHKLTNRNTRLNNLKNTQAVSTSIPPHTAVILIDDVTTTGATLDESRRALKIAGVKHIFAFTIAH